MSEAVWLAALAAVALVALLWGRSAAATWLLHSGYPSALIGPLHNTTLPSFAERAGCVCLFGALLGLLSLAGIRSAVLATVSSESLLVYLFHLTLIYGVLQAGPLVRVTGWEPLKQGWSVTLLLTAIVIGISVAIGALWARTRKKPELASRWRRRGAYLFLAYFLLGGWYSVYKYWRWPERATKPYYLLKLKGAPLPPAD